MTTIFQLITDPAYPQKMILDKLLRHHLQTDQAGLIAMYDNALDPTMIQTIHAQYTDYIQNNKPLEYVLGEVEFFGNRFIVNPDTLIPRPETEYMILAVSDHVASLGSGSHVLIDVGTGCGVLGLSTLIRHPESFAQVYLTEISPQALSIAQKNLTQYRDQIGQVSVELLQSSLLDGMIDGRIQIDHDDDTQQIVIVANLPYIPDGTFDNDVEQSVKQREPRMAFVGGNDGNDWYRKMFDQLLDDPKVGDYANRTVMFLEMMTWQLDILRQEYTGRMEFEICHTFHFNIIIVRGMITNNE